MDGCSTSCRAALPTYSRHGVRLHRAWHPDRYGVASIGTGHGSDEGRKDAREQAPPAHHRRYVRRHDGAANRLTAILDEAMCLIDPSAQIACDGFSPHALGPDVVALAAQDRPKAVNLNGGSSNATGA
jgi:hypothetical protein